MKRTKVIIEQDDDVTADQVAHALDCLSHKIKARHTPDVEGPLVDGTGRIIAEVRMVHS